MTNIDLEAEKNCIFCKMVRGEIPVYKVYEDEQTLAFLDINPINRGHTLVIPKKHEPEFQDLDDETYTQMMLVVKKLSNTMNAKMKPKRVGLMIAGWDVPHTHVHVVPMENKHDIASKRAIDGVKLELSDEEFASIAETLKT